jgi:hypothetical protein
MIEKAAISERGAAAGNREIYEAAMQQAEPHYTNAKLGNQKSAIDTNETMFGDIARRIVRVESSLMFMTDKMSNLGDRLFGARPETGVAEADPRNSEPNCALDDIAMRLRDLEYITARLEHTLERFDDLA